MRWDEGPVILHRQQADADRDSDLVFISDTTWNLVFIEVRYLLVWYLLIFTWYLLVRYLLVWYLQDSARWEDELW